jgi:hypothetical protein
MCALAAESACLLLGRDGSVRDVSGDMGQLEAGEVVFTRRQQYCIPADALAQPSSALAGDRDRVCEPTLSRVEPGVDGCICLNAMWPCVVRGGPAEALWNPVPIVPEAAALPFTSDDPILAYSDATGHEAEVQRLAQFLSVWLALPSPWLEAMLHDTFIPYLGSTGTGKSSTGMPCCCSEWLCPVRCMTVPFSPQGGAR